MINESLVYNQARQEGASFKITKVTGKAEEWFFVHDVTIRRVKRAVGCLIEPEVGDLVLLCEAANEQTSFIINVLLRERADAGNVCLPGGVIMHTVGKQLTVHADSVDLKARETIGLSTVHLDINAVAATTRVGHLQTWADSMETTVERVTLTAKSFTEQVGRMISRIRESWRKVEGLDETRAARMTVYVQGSHQIDAQHVSVNAEGFVRIDGKTINIG